MSFHAGLFFNKLSLSFVKIKKFLWGWVWHVVFNWNLLILLLLCLCENKFVFPQKKKNILSKFHVPLYSSEILFTLWWTKTPLSFNWNCVGPTKEQRHHTKKQRHPYQKVYCKSVAYIISINKRKGFVHPRQRRVNKIALLYCSSHCNPHIVGLCFEAYPFYWLVRNKSKVNIENLYVEHCKILSFFIILSLLSFSPTSFKNVRLGHLERNYSVFSLLSFYRSLKFIKFDSTLELIIRLKHNLDGKTNYD